MMVIYACIGMVEGPSFARILHAAGWRSRLSGVYIDEAHLVHESHTWRPAYSRIHRLRVLLADEVPLIATSATLPSTYQRSLITFAGLKPNYTLLNYVVYTDNLELLTKMFWCLLSRLAATGLPAHLIDIIHAGLSEDHQRICEQDFREGSTMFLLGSEKIGAGINFRDVCRVIQYVCKGITVSKWSQRRGRGGGRKHDGSAVGYLMPEKALTSEGELSVDNPGNEDPEIIDLIQSSECSEFIYDRWLENPPRDCHRCCPTLLPGQEYVVFYCPLFFSLFESRFKTQSNEPHFAQRLASN
ncbi:hypothetical protein B0H14DRAFT_3083680 [Mycena olivaceomarginata]|nr:hypothetical protein B0H14DRAFT_3083680 [Mycena olivaceomarginata]